MKTYLDYTDIDFDNKTITVLHLKKNIKIACSICGARLSRKHQYCPECGLKISDTKKSQGERRRIRLLPVDESTIEMIRSYMNHSHQHNGNDSNHIFNINRHRAWQIVRECAARAGISNLMNPETGRERGVSPHCLRDAFSVHAMKTDDSGDGLRLLQEHLSHARFNTTAKYRKLAGDEHHQ